MNSKDFFKTVNQICEEYKTEHGIKDDKPQPKFQAGQPVLWSGYSGLKYPNMQLIAKTPRITILREWNEEDKHWHIDGCGWDDFWHVAESELRGVGDTVYWDGIGLSGEGEPRDIIIDDITTTYVVVKFGKGNIRIAPEHLSFTPPEPKIVYGERGHGLTGWIIKPARPAPKFAVGDKTNQGMIMFINHYGYDTLYTALKDGEYHNYFESELTKLPESGITVTLWRVDKDGKVVTETNTYPPEMNNWHRDGRAENAFSSGYCAILIDDGKTKQRRYCPEIEDVLEFIPKNSWHDVEYKREIIPEIIKDAVNLPRWTVTSNGVKMRAYAIEQGMSVEFCIDKPDIKCSRNFYFTSFTDCSVVKALGFTSENTMPQILSGKE